jgi:hypothetical protein
MKNHNNECDMDCLHNGSGCDYGFKMRSMTNRAVRGRRRSFRVIMECMQHSKDEDQQQTQGCHYFEHHSVVGWTKHAGRRVSLNSKQLSKSAASKSSTAV